jgi:hypothetical protein
MREEIDIKVINENVAWLQGIRMNRASWPRLLLNLFPVDLEPKAWFKLASDQILSETVLNIVIGDLIYFPFCFGISGIPINSKGARSPSIKISSSESSQKLSLSNFGEIKDGSLLSFGEIICIHEVSPS